MIAKTYGLMLKAEMILAYIAGIKWQTRRTKGLDEINQNPNYWQYQYRWEEKTGPHAVFVNKKDSEDTRSIRLPYGDVRSTLYFKETWKMWEREEDGQDFLHYRADDAKVDPAWWSTKDWTGPNKVWVGKFEKWQPSMLMPRICSRFRDVQITGVRVERLHDISEVDAIAEGCVDYFTESFRGKSARAWYFDLWDKINGSKLPSSKNPWLFVYEFVPLKENPDAA